MYIYFCCCALVKSIITPLYLKPEPLSPTSKNRESLGLL